MKKIVLETRHQMMKLWRMLDTYPTFTCKNCVFDWSLSERTFKYIILSYYLDRRISCSTLRGEKWDSAVHIHINLWVAACSQYRQYIAIKIKKAKVSQRRDTALAVLARALPYILRSAGRNRISIVIFITVMREERVRVFSAVWDVRLKEKLLCSNIAFLKACL